VHVSICVLQVHGSHSKSAAPQQASHRAYRLVDDLGGAIGKARDPRRMEAIIKLVRSFGWVLAPEKIVDSLLHRIKLLGFMLDTSTMSIGVPAARMRLRPHQEALCCIISVCLLLFLNRKTEAQGKAEQQDKKICTSLKGVWIL
jgi:hypothetical protein